MIEPNVSQVMNSSGERYRIDNKKEKKEPMKIRFELTKNDDVNTFDKNITEKFNEAYEESKF